MDLAAATFDWQATATRHLADLLEKGVLQRLAGGGGPGGALVWSDEGLDGQGISSHGIRELAAKVFSMHRHRERYGLTTVSFNPYITFND